MTNTVTTGAAPTAHLDSAHVGDIHGGMGTIRVDAGAPRGWGAKMKTLVAILGPGLIVMVGDNDAGAFGTYTQAGQNYGTTLLWTLLLLVPVLYVNQEMVVRLGAVTGVGHARLILERFGKFWGAFSVIDLFLLNALTIVTEFIGITLAVGYLGLPKVPSVVLATVLVVGAASTGSFRRFERLCLILVAGSLLLIPIYVLAHPPVTEMAHSFVTPAFPPEELSTVMLLIIGIVGTTVAPWQLSSSSPTSSTSASPPGSWPTRRPTCGSASSWSWWGARPCSASPRPRSPAPPTPATSSTPGRSPPA